MENYLLCGEIGGAVAQNGHSESNGILEVHDGGCLLYKGRRKGTVNFVGIWKHSKTKKDVVANGVSVRRLCLSQPQAVYFCSSCVMFQCKFCVRSLNHRSMPEYPRV